MGLREQILQAQDLERKAVEVPEWNCTVWVRELTGSEGDDLEAETYKVRGKEVEVNRKNFRARLLRRALVDEQGAQVFDAKDLELLGAKSSKVLKRLADIASEMSGISKKDEEDLVKNSPGAPSGANGSASPDISEDAPLPSGSSA